MNLTLIINATTLSIAALAATVMLFAAFGWRNNTSGGQMSFLTIWGLAGFLVTAFFSNLIFDTNHFLAFVPAFFIPFTDIGLLLMPLLIPNKSFKWFHWLILGSAVPLAILNATPGIVFEDVVPNADGYPDLIFGAYAPHIQIISTALMVCALFVYIYRLYAEPAGPSRTLVRNLAIGFFVAESVAIGSSVVLPIFGYNQLVAVGSAFWPVIMMAAITYAYTRYGEETKKDVPRAG